ncbi:PREDICTED: uncharacterized protein LOC108977811 [Bactrocera latifrons]|uniref:uncharacterized protein LOC108977811 n=1 Tax=Bactrocera latifrons TaxID=174628 RepID=UPI0008DD6D48|nr:PREDICTED: uncharacterized protein LOC108977811 [Bactrocera latifrons]
MKPKKGAFANSSSGYGKSRNSFRNNAGKQEEADAKVEEKLKADKCKELHSENDLNSGFGDYLRSPEAVEIMKLFVFANTIMLIVTMAWPNFKEQYYMLREWLESFQVAQ